MEIYEGLTFDDVLLVPQYSNVSLKEISIKTYLTKNLKLNIPLVSAAMDTVTESKLAINLALLGGIGIIHKNLPPELQAREIEKVKKFESLVILDPVTVTEDTPISKIKKIMKENDINGILVVSNNNILKGIITNRDLRFIKSKNEKVTKFMTPYSKLITATKDISISEAKNILSRHKIEKLPIIDKNGELIGLITYKDIIKKSNYPDAAKDNHGRLLVGAAVGVLDDAYNRVPQLIEKEVDVIVIDTAHGHSENVKKTLKWIKSNYSIDVVAGNIATKEGAKFLADNGADAIKVGIGPGSICTTRIIAGIGIPQLTAIMDVYKYLKNSEIKLIADGGIRFSGDIVKALAAGSDSVMIGNIFSQVEESAGKMYHINGKTYKIYRGMGSIEAMKKGSKDRYGQENIDEESKLVPEGISGSVPYRGKLKDVVYQLVGGLKAGMGYLGARNIEEMKIKAKFIKLTNSSLKESYHHDVLMIKEPPNYWL